MPRLVDAFEQFFDLQGEPLAFGLVDFYESGSNTVRKSTFSDSGETIPNPNPVILNGDGRCPNVFGSGTYRAVLRTSGGNQILQRDPVGGTDEVVFGADWSSERVYGVSDVVRFNNEYYVSQSNNNLNNNPGTDDGSNWSLVIIDYSAVVSRQTATDYEDLRSKDLSNLIDGQQITVTNDGIGGVFVVRTGTVTDNGGTLIVFNDDSNRYCERLQQNPVHVKWFGATGDGSTDDAASIQLAINYIKQIIADNVLSATQLNFSSDLSLYRVASGLDFTSIRRTCTIDLGGATILADYDGGDPVIDLVDQRYVTLRNGEIRTNGSSHPQCGILLARRATDDRVTSYCRLNGLFVQGQYEIAAIANISSELSSTENCRFNNTYEGGVGVYSGIYSDQNTYGLSSSHVTITSNSVSNICHYFQRTSWYKQNCNQGYGLEINGMQYVNGDRLFLVVDGDDPVTYVARAAARIQDLVNSDIDLYVERQVNDAAAGQDYTCEVVGNISNLNMQVVGNNQQSNNLLINEVSEVRGCRLAASKGIQVDHTTTATQIFQSQFDGKNGASVDLSGARFFSGRILVDDLGDFTTLGTNPHNLFAEFVYDNGIDTPYASRIVNLSANELSNPKRYSIINTTSDFDTITDTSNIYQDGSIIYCRANAGRTVTVKHNTGNIRCKSAADFVLSVQAPSAFIYDATFSQWLCME